MTPQTLEYLSHLSTLTAQPIYLVGGSVRDLLIGVRDIKDIDLLIPSGSEDVARAFADRIGGSFFFLDEERRITRVVKQADGETIQFDFTNFEGPDLNADLGRRDFTMNAMAMDLREFIKDQSLEKVIDLFHGREDVENKLIRITKPEVLDKDPLRLLRAVRFAASLGFTIEETTKDSIRSRAVLVAKPSPERIRDEFFQVLSQRGAGGHLMLMDSLGLLSRLVPELDTLTGFSPGRYHTYDVRTHSIKAAGYVDAVLDDLPKTSPEYADRVLQHLDDPLENLIPRKAALRFACLLHDIAKPETFSQDEGGHIHFYGHDNLGAEKAKEACKRLRLSRDTESMVTAVIKQHMRLFNLSAPGGPSKNAMYRYCRDMKDALPESLVLAQADARATYDIMPREMFTDTEKPMAAVLAYYYENFLKTEAKPLVTGNDLIERGLKPGPRFREILDAVRERQSAGLFKDRREALEFVDGLR
jgi:poly(A) polymerase